MSRPVEIVLARLGDSVSPSGPSGRQWVALCPAHDDAKRSLAVGETKDGKVLLKCYAGCAFGGVVKALGLEQSDLFPEDDAKRPVPLTVGLLAWDKRLPAEFLRNECHLRDDPDRGEVHMPYYDQARRPLFVRRRTHVVAKKGTWQPAGVRLQTYGQWRLPKAREDGDALVLVEGESDCWTLWFHGAHALGVPGASAVQTLTADLLAGVKSVLCWQEPDDAGEKFVADVAKQLAAAGWKGKLSVISGGPVKDPSALHQRDPGGFKAAWQALAAAAHPARGKAEKKPPARPSAHTPGDVLEAVAEPPPGGGPDGGAPGGPAAPPPLPAPSPGYYALTDWGNAQRLVFRHGKDVRYVHPWGRWLVWDGRRWSPDDTGEVDRKVIDTVRSIYREAEAAKEPLLRERLHQHFLNSQAVNRVRAFAELARSAPGVPVSPDALDADPWLFNARNGTVDLRTGALLPHDRGRLLTKLAPVDYDPDAGCPAWCAFLLRIMGGSAELVRYLQAAVGYSLTASVGEKCFFFLYGSGDNGKSTLLEALAELMGDYWAKTTAETVLARYGQNQGIPNDVARLVGTRFVSTAELPEGRRLDEAKVKDLTGNDTISARFMRGEWFDFRPVFKLWMYGNHKPRIGGDDAIWRRVRLIPFNVTIPKAEQDPALPAKLRAELPGILAWAVRGCLEWQKGGLPPPPAVREATEEYRGEMDLIAAFIADKCHVSRDTAVRCPAAALYSAFVSYCRANGEEPGSQRAFGLQLKTRGLRQGRDDSKRYWTGIDLIGRNVSPSRNGHARELAEFDE